MIFLKRQYKFSKLIKEAVKLIHNRQYIDHYWYLKSNPDSMASIIQKENTIKQQFFDHPDVKQLFDDYYQTSYNRKDSNIGDIPEYYDEFQYSTRFAFFNTGNDYQIIEKQLKNGEKQIVLDLATIAFLKQYHATMKMVKMHISDDHKLIAFGMDVLNNEDIIWLIKYVDDDRVLSTKLFECFDAKFTKDGKQVLYTQYDDKFRPYKLMLHTIGTLQEQDQLLYEEKDEQFYLDLQQSKDKEYFILLTQSKETNEVILIKRDNPTQLQTLFSRNSKTLQYPQHHQDGFYVLTNQNTYDHKVLKQEGDKFIDYYIPQEGEVLQEVDLFHTHLIMYFTKDSESFIRVIELPTKQIYDVIIPPSLVYTNHQENKKGIIKSLFDKVIKKDKSQKFLNLKVDNQVLAATIQPGVNQNYKSDSFRFHLTTPLTYEQVYQFNLKDKFLTKLQDSKLTGKPFLREQYVATRIYAPTKDGNTIPITLVHKKTMQKNRQNKLLLHSYGAYGVAQDLPFNIVYLNALEKGWVLAFAHLRGGNERGQQWHKAAILENKIKSVEDLIASASALVAQGYTHPALLCGLGASAGATILGAALNMRPDMWKCGVLLSPFLDVTNSLLDDTLPLTKSDYLEFGNPNEKKYFESILSYSPYDNISSQVYPAIYVSAGSEDFRAPLWNVLKWSEKLRKTAQESKKIENIIENGLIVDINDGGHYGGAGAQSVIEERSKYMSFLEYYVGKGNKEITIQNLTQNIDESIQLEKD